MGVWVGLNNSYKKIKYNIYNYCSGGLAVNLNMAKVIEEIANMSITGQEFVLKNMAQELVPLSIDGKVYMIPKEVSELIEMLVADTSETVQSQEDKPHGLR